MEGAFGDVFSKGENSERGGHLQSTIGFVDGKVVIFIT